MKKYLSGLFLIIVLFSCNKPDKEEVIPSGVIGADTMAMVISDLHIAESYSNFRGMNDIINETNSSKYYSEIFLKYDLTSESFIRSYSYYLEKPERMDKIYTKVLEQLSKTQAEVRSDDVK